MSTLPDWAFGRHAPHLAGDDFEPIPITRPWDPVPDAGKRPAVKGWQNGFARDQWPRFADYGVGILTRNAPAIDIDTMDRELGDLLQELADTHLGNAPVRYGEAPRRAMIYRLEGEPFRKIRVDWQPLAGSADEGRDKLPGVEVMANGQPLVVLGEHPRTGLPYRWERDPELRIPRALLPPLSRDQAQRFLEVAAQLVEDLGGKVQLDPRPRPAPVRVAAPRPPREPGDLADRIEDALDRLGNADLDYDTWIRIGMALKGALGEDGRDLWCDWSARSSKDQPKVTERKWKTFKPTAIGAGSLFHLLRGIGR